jgi:hypothetical protein
MKKKRKIEIVVERHQVIVIRGFEARVPQWCSQCAERAQMVGIDEAAAIFGAGAVYSRAEGGGIHCIETTAGSLLICLNSLLRYKEISI